MRDCRLKRALTVRKAARTRTCAPTSICDYSDVGAIGGYDDFVAVEQEAFAGVDGEAGCTRGGHDFDRLDANGRNVEALVLIRFCDLDDGESAGERRGVIT